MKKNYDKMFTTWLCKDNIVIIFNILKMEFCKDNCNYFFVINNNNGVWLYIDILILYHRYFNSIS
jgi:hypothetical protein